MASTASPCNTPPVTHTHLRIGRLRTKAAMTSWGSSEPDSRIGTSQPTIQTGAATAPKIQARVVFGLMSWSPSLVRLKAVSWRKKLPGTTRQASSSISRQTRASSSSTSRS